MCKISIIIPVYNIEKYINNCIDSILCQTYTNFEIIIIDDGSTDKSGEICDSYKETFIKVYHKKNNGVSSARNDGIKYSNGDYIMFMDGDDFLYDKNCLLKISKNFVGNYDLIMYKMIYYYPNNSKYLVLPDYPNIDDLNMFDKYKILISNSKVPVSPCDKLVKRSLLLEKNLYFDETLKRLEDVDWSLEILKHTKSLKCLNENIYAYRQQRIGSSSNTFDKNVLDNYKQFIKKWVREENIGIDYFPLFLNYVSYQYILFLAILKENKLYKYEKQFIMKYKYLLKNNLCYKVKFTYRLSKIIGLNMTANLLLFYLKNRKKGLFNI